MGAVERPEITGFADFDAGHRDLVTVTRFNFYGNRIVTASSDHRMKVWDLKDGQWQLIDTWRAHDAEIRDVRLQTNTSYWACAGTSG
jgi:nucleoporin SEH1